MLLVIYMIMVFCAVLRTLNDLEKGLHNSIYYFGNGAGVKNKKEVLMNKEEKISYGMIISRCWSEEDFKQRFKDEPAVVLKEFNIEPEEGVEYQVIEAEPLVQYIVLPHENALEGVQQFSKLMLQKTESSEVIIPDGAQVRVIQDTEKKRYLVIPFNPQLITETDFMGGRLQDSITINQDVVLQVEAAIEVVLAEATTVATTLHAGIEAVAIAVIGIVFI